MTQAGNTQEQLHHNGPEVCAVSLEAARPVVDTLLAEFANPDSVLYSVIAHRASKMSPEAQLSLSPTLLVDPSRSIFMARWQMQAGSIPADAAPELPEQAVMLWAPQKEAIPKLEVPPGKDSAIMDLADRLKMRGGGPLIYAREELSGVELGKRPVINVVGGANLANRERLRTALALVEGQPLDLPIVASATPLRILNETERGKVSDFAPNARNEVELLIASALKEGFTPDASSMLGSTYLRDGSSYMKMRSPDGRELIVLVPKVVSQIGLMNAYQTLLNHGEEEFGLKLEGSDMWQVTSTHYGLTSAINNLRAVHELRTQLGSFRVAGDNQPPEKRGAMAHLVEFGLTLDFINQAFENPTLKQKMLAIETQA